MRTEWSKWVWKHALFAPLFFNPSGLNVGRPGWLFLNRAGGFKIKDRPGEGGGRKMPGGFGIFTKKEGREQNICMT